MEIEEAKRELKEYTENKRYLEQKQEDIERLTEQINKVTATYSDMPRSTGNSKEDLIAKKLDLESVVFSYLITLVDKKIVIEKTLQKLRPRYRNVLDFLHVEDMTMGEVAAKEHYSSRHCERILAEAYKQYAKARGDKNE